MTLHLIHSDVTPIVRDMGVEPNEARRPRYLAEGRHIVTVSSGRVQTPPTARRAAAELLEACLATRDEGLAETDTLALADLVRAIRQAERNDPTPPAAVARAA
ncbi:MAG: hypothetical protein EON87_04410 [Brevundimonas sp.]|nr:MAG: hypothetical protein EON87_04410 [Brevundimonas sp.]